MLLKRPIVFSQPFGDPFQGLVTLVAMHIVPLDKGKVSCKAMEMGIALLYHQKLLHQVSSMLAYNVWMMSLYVVHN